MEVGENLDVKLMGLLEEGHQQLEANVWHVANQMNILFYQITKSSTSRTLVQVNINGQKDTPCSQKFDL